MVIVSRFVH